MKKHQKSDQSNTSMQSISLQNHKPGKSVKASSSSSLSSEMVHNYHEPSQNHNHHHSSSSPSNRNSISTHLSSSQYSRNSTYSMRVNHEIQSERACSNASGISSFEERVDYAIQSEQGSNKASQISSYEGQVDRLIMSRNALTSRHLSTSQYSDAHKRLVDTMIKSEYSRGKSLRFDIPTYEHRVDQMIKSEKPKLVEALSQLHVARKNEVNYSVNTHGVSQWQVDYSKQQSNKALMYSQSMPGYEWPVGDRMKIEEAQYDNPLYLEALWASLYMPNMAGYEWPMKSGQAYGNPLEVS